MAVPRPEPPDRERPDLAQNHGARVRPLQGIDKLRYIVNNLALTPDQRETGDAFLAVYDEAVKAEQADPQPLITKLTDLATRAQAAQQAGDQEEAARLREELQAAGPGKGPEREFFEQVESILTDEQKAKLEWVQKRLQKYPDAKVRPIEIVRVAKRLDLSAEQSKKLVEVQVDFRDAMKKTPVLTDDKRTEMLALITDNVRAILTPEQAERFDQMTATLGPPAPAETPPPRTR